MREQEIQAFIDVVIAYFTGVSEEPSEMGVPFIKQEQSVVLEYTGAIGISGARKGAIYFTASGALLQDLAQVILGVEAEEDDLYDLVGEVTNTIAGNMRETFGSEFMISVPMVLKGNLVDVQLQLNPPVFVIPIEWREHKSFLAIGLE